MKKLIYLLLLLTISGCSSYYVKVNSYSEIENSSEGYLGKIYVVANPKAANPIFDRMIKNKIIKLLKAKRLNVTNNVDTADYYLVYSYGINSGRNVTSHIPVYIPGKKYKIDTASSGNINTVSNGNYSGNVGSLYGTTYSNSHVNTNSTSTIKTESSVDWQSRNKTVYDRSLVLHLADAKIARKDNKIKAVWIAEVSSTGSSNNLREAIDYMLYPAIKNYGRNITKNYELNEDDPVIKMLNAQ